MKPLTEREIRSSFVNCSKGEAARLSLPRDLGELPWEDLDFLGWRDPGAPDRGYLVAPHPAGPEQLAGVSLRATAAGRGGYLRRSMCSICLTTHPGGGVSLMTAPKAGRAGRDGNSTGVYMCSDLLCSLYVRGRKAVAPGGRFEETLTVEEQIQRTRERLAAFLTTLYS
jgi:hypothetical protein